MFRCFLLIVFVLFPFCRAATSHAQNISDLRTWESDKGHKIEAILVEADDDSVRLKKSDGKSIEVKIDKLSKVDQKFLKNLKAKKSDQQRAKTNNQADDELEKPVALEEDIQQMGKLINLSGGGTLRNPFLSNYSSQSSSNTWNGKKVSVFEMTSTEYQGEVVAGYAFQKDSKRNHRQSILKMLNKSLDQPVVEKGGKDVKWNKFSTKKPIPDWLGVKGTFTSPTGAQGYLCFYLYFGEQTHLLLAVSEDQQRVEQLSKAFGTLREEDDEEVATIEDGPLVGFGRPEESSEEFRMWKDATGKFNINAVLIDHSDGFVSLETRSGKEIKMAVEKLSDQDQSYLKQSK